MFRAYWQFGTVNFEKIKLIRTETLLEEYGMDNSVAFDENDHVAAHLIIEEAQTGDMIAAARIFPDNADTRIGHLTVRKKYRASRYDDFALRMLLFKARDLVGERIIADVAERDMALYERFGFKHSSNAENGLFLLALAKKDIDLSGECEKESE